MAGLYASVQIAEIAISATTRTLVQLQTPTNQRIKIKSWGVYFDGTSATAEPVQVEFVRQTTAGTSSAATVVKKNDEAETVQTTATQTFTSTDPTTTDVIEAKEVHTQSGYEKIYPPGDEIVVGGGKRIGIRYIAGAGAGTPNVRVEVSWEE